MQPAWRRSSARRSSGRERYLASSDEVSGFTIPGSLPRRVSTFRLLDGRRARRCIQEASSGGPALAPVRWVRSLGRILGHPGGWGLLRGFHLVEGSVEVVGLCGVARAATTSSGTVWLLQQSGSFRRWSAGRRLSLGSGPCRPAAGRSSITVCTSPSRSLVDERPRTSALAATAWTRVGRSGELLRVGFPLGEGLRPHHDTSAARPT